MKAIIPYEQHQAIIEKYKKGISSLRLGVEYGVTYTNILRILRRHNVKIVNHGNPKGRTTQKIPPEKHSEIIEKYKAGRTMLQLGIEYDACRGTILRILHKNKVKARLTKQNTNKESPMHKSKVSIKLRKKITKAYQEGESSEQLGLKYNLSPQTIINTVRRQGIPTKPKGRICKVPIEYRRAIAKWYQEGKTSQQLGLEYDLSPETVIKIVRSQGVKIRPPGITKGVTIVKGTTEREKRNALIIEKYKSGIRVLDLCKEFDLERSHIYRIFYKNKVKAGKSGNPQGNGSFRKVSLEKYSEVKEKFLAGKTMNQLAIEYNVNRNTIRNVLFKSGITSFKHLNCRNDIVVDTIFNKAESKRDKVSILGKQYQDLFPSEQKKFLDWIGNCCGGKPSLLADVLQTFNKDQEKTQVVCIGSVAGSILLKIAMTGSGTPFWRGCLGDIESEDLEKVRKCLVEELKQREEEVKPFLKGMTIEWMEIEKILRERKKNLG